MNPRAFVCPNCGAPLVHMSIRSADAMTVTCRSGCTIESMAALAEDAPSVRALPGLELRLAWRAVLHADSGLPGWWAGTFEDPRDAADAVRENLGKPSPWLRGKTISGSVRAVMLVGTDGSWMELNPTNGCTITPATRPLRGDSNEPRIPIESREVSARQALAAVAGALGVAIGPTDTTKTVRETSIAAINARASHERARRDRGESFATAAGWRAFWRLFEKIEARPIPGYTGTTDIHGGWIQMASVAGEDFGAPWVAVLRLTNGRFAVASCHVEVTTDNGGDGSFEGQDARFDIQLAETLADLVRLGLTTDGRQRLRGQDRELDEAIDAFRAGGTK